MKILLITDEVWSDSIHGNNILTNWFEGMDVEIANIYCSPGLPDNKCCKQYFQVTDGMMAKSLLGGKKAGNAFEWTGEKQIQEAGEPEHKKAYAILKSITTESLRAVREWIWLHGRYDVETLQKFIEEFQPDIVYSPRYGTRKIMRLERMVHGMTGAPFVAFTADDEYTLKQVRFSPVYWVRRFLNRRDLRRNVNFYQKYYMFSREQAAFYHEEFQIPTQCLYKNGVFEGELCDKSVNKPIRMVYAGKLYCNRWKVLAQIGKALKMVNQDEVKMILEIYTKDVTSEKQKHLLHDDRSIFLREPVTVEELKKVYEVADIALHVESQDLKNRLLTRYSFSTKIIDCLASGCAVMAVCPKEQSGYRYLKDEDAAICVEDEARLEPVLRELAEHPQKVLEYRKKAWQCGLRNHEKKKQQELLMQDFQEVILQYRRKQQSEG